MLEDRGLGAPIVFGAPGRWRSSLSHFTNIRFIGRRASPLPVFNVSCRGHLFVDVVQHIDVAQHAETTGSYNRSGIEERTKFRVVGVASCLSREASMSPKLYTKYDLTSKVVVSCAYILVLVFFVAVLEFVLPEGKRAAMTMMETKTTHQGRNRPLLDETVPREPSKRRPSTRVM